MLVLRYPWKVSVIDRPAGPKVLSNTGTAFSESVPKYWYT